MEVLVVRAESARPPAVRLVYGAEPGEWTPVEGAADVVRSSGRAVRLEDREEAMIGRLLVLVARPIPARFHDVDLSCRQCKQGAIMSFIILVPLKGHGPYAPLTGSCVIRQTSVCLH